MSRENPILSILDGDLEQLQNAIYETPESLQKIRLANIYLILELESLRTFVSGQIELFLGPGSST